MNLKMSPFKNKNIIIQGMSAEEQTTHIMSELQSFTFMSS